MAKPSRFRRLIIGICVVAVLVAGGYFANVQIQSNLGRKALASTGLDPVSLREAVTQAHADGKVVLLDVAAIWCPTCRALDQNVFANADVGAYIEKHFVFARLEYESAEGTAFLQEQGARGFPTLWLVDGSGKVLRQLPVTMDPDAFLRELKSSLPATSSETT